MHFPSRSHLPFFFLVLGLTGMGFASHSLFADGKVSNSQTDIMEVKENGTVVNWTLGYISARYSIPMPEVRMGSLTEARRQALREAKEQAMLHLWQSIEGLPIDASSTIRQRLKADRNFRERVGSLNERILETGSRISEGSAVAELRLPFYGRRGLAELVQPTQEDAFPEADALPVDDDYTGIVIDASGIAGFLPTLQPRIFSHSGRILYGAQFADRGCAIEKGIVTYHGIRGQLALEKRVGRKPFYIYAAGLYGHSVADLFLDEDDASRLMGSKKNQRLLKKCTVAIIASQVQKAP